jgi:beta-phosphoglucomutase-like phosphatase (HAD superfamily)
MLKDTCAVVFDFDGVLADTERLHFAAFRDVLARHGWRLEERAYFDRYLGFDDDALVAAFARDEGLAISHPVRAALVAEKGDLFLDRLQAGGVLYAGAREVVGRLGAHFPLGIASGSFAGEIRLILDAAGLRSAFRVIIGADDVARTKPAPDPYAAAIRGLGVAPAAAVAIEDSHWGLESAKSAGLRTIALATTYPASALGVADLVLPSLDHVTVDAVLGLIRGCA